MRIRFTKNQSKSFVNHMMDTGMRQLYVGSYPVLNCLEDPNEEDTILICDENTVFCIRLIARLSQLERIVRLMNFWGNFERSYFIKKKRGPQWRRNYLFCIILLHGNICKSRKDNSTTRATAFYF